ncbi:FMN-dependent dehydrogenase [Fusarium albosuccineum]|uniref:FMN-dependent dehydrogenase n=1 Tax=Fusarium albosuccineum TaxID=1237068 RepID=A0A8H4P809_9HYPO|nr:FMN-dependent dehydrogenase [Fusarium albosuccineum]
MENPKAEPVTVADVKELAQQRLDPAVWNYYTTGADQEQTVQRNSSIFQELFLRPRVLRDVSDIDTSTKILNKRYDFPIAIAPSAYQKLAGGQGEIDLTRAAHTLGTNFILSTNATTSLEDVAQALPQRAPEYPSPWFQLYFLKSRKLTGDLIRRADQAGYEALVLTVDTPILGNRLQERRKPLELPPHMKMGNAASRRAGAVSKAGLVLRARTAADHKKLTLEFADSLVDSSLTWDEAIPWLRSQTKMKIILKGILTAEDARRALEAGVDAIIVSNHGGRQLDGVPSTLEALPEIVDEVRGKITVILDGGISRGSDVFKALALGADLCLIGRCALWGLAWDGQRGVEGVLHILERELARTMALMGAATLRDISRSMLGRAKKDGFGISKL